MNLREHIQKKCVIFHVAEPSHMADHKFLRADAKLRTLLIPLFFRKSEFPGVNGIGDGGHPARRHHFFPEHGFPREAGAGQAHIRLFAKIFAQEAGHGTLQPGIHTGASGMGDGERHARRLRDGKVNGSRAGHMSVYRHVPRMLPKQILPGLPVCQPVYHLEPGNPVYMPAQAFNFFIKKAFLL